MTGMSQIHTVFRMGAYAALMKAMPRVQCLRCLVLLALALALGAGELLAWWWALRSDNSGLLLQTALGGAALSVAATAYCLWLWQKGEAARQGLLRARELLTSSLDTLDIGLEIWDADDRLVLFNNKINPMRIDLLSPKDIGKTFEELLREKLRRREILAAVGREIEWLTQRLATRGSNPQPQLKEYAGNQWFMTRETRTPSGYLVSSWIDFTELVQKGRMLEASNMRLMQQSNMDPLTGLANRRSFDQAVSAECQRASRAAAHLSLMLVDIDHFKLFNDHYGHLAGDECLRRVASVLHRCVRRAGEMVARYGGEEFVVLLPGSDAQRSCNAAQQCLERMRAEGIAHASSPTAGQVTLSIGVASASDRFLQPGSILNAADAAMYRAKSGGRARYQMAEQEDWDIDKDTARTRPGALR
jgi:diguanylate cyclase (GGDEF)-like protein